MEIKRDKYLEMLQIRRHNGFVKVITGIRRCGKSYLMNDIFYEKLKEDGVNENHIIKFAFDSAEDLLLIGEDLQELFANKPLSDKSIFPRNSHFVISYRICIMCVIEVNRQYFSFRKKLAFQKVRNFTCL